MGGRAGGWYLANNTHKNASDCHSTNTIDVKLNFACSNNLQNELREPVWPEMIVLFWALGNFR